MSDFRKIAQLAQLYSTLSQPAEQQDRNRQQMALGVLGLAGDQQQRMSADKLRQAQLELENQKLGLEAQKTGAEIQHLTQGSQADAARLALAQSEADAAAKARATAAWYDQQNFESQMQDRANLLKLKKEQFGPSESNNLLTHLISSGTMTADQLAKIPQLQQFIGQTAQSGAGNPAVIEQLRQHLSQRTQSQPPGILNQAARFAGQVPFLAAKMSWQNLQNIAKYLQSKSQPQTQP